MAAARPQTVPVAAARRLLLRGAGLLAHPDRSATPARVAATIEALGFVQVDTISVVERAHDLILRTRLSGYEPAQLKTVLERRRSAFEHWTHDASIVPTRALAQWKARFRRYRKRGPGASAWWREQMGSEPGPLLAAVRQRIEREGPLRSRDFDQPVAPGAPARGGWWNWKPAKAALEFLWREGSLTVTRRDGFEKVYDLMERVFPQVGELPEPDAEAHTHWACSEALDRLGLASAAELAGFFGAVELSAARSWCQRALADGRALPVLIESADGSAPQAGLAHPHWRRRANSGPDAPQRIRLLSPFDPVLRDRKRAARRFGFEYRFEAFVPAAQRTYGYYVLPLLEGERLIGRVDCKAHRDRSELCVQGLWWEPGVAPDRPRRARLDDALDALAAANGATTVTRARGLRR